MNQFERMSALADPVRSRMLVVLERHELTVGELCDVFQLPQSTMSRHLKGLADEGWVAWRAEGTSRRYRMPLDRLDGWGRRLWNLVREEVAGSAAAEQDANRLRSVLAERRSRSQEFFTASAAEWDRLRAEMFGRRWDLRGLLGLLDPEWVVGDLGTGTGHVAEMLAPFVGRVVGVDASPAMLEAARHRLGGQANVEIRGGDLEALPIDDASLDVALLLLVLHYVQDPGVVLREVARVLRPGGRLLIVDMLPHEREEYRLRMGHVWLGFEPERLGDWLESAGLARTRHLLLPPEPEARGPELFVATGRKG